MQLRFKKSGLIAFAAAAFMSAPALSAEFKIGLDSDPDLLDPDQSTSLVGRIVYTSLCDKLVDITPDLQIVGQLATDWQFSEDGKTIFMQLRKGVKFHDGTPFDAEAVKYNIERSLSLPESRRKSEVKSVQEVVVTASHDLEIRLVAPDAALMAQFADRSGMMISPTEAKKAGAKFSQNPVCSGPFKFQKRIHQERIVLEKFDEYWNANNINFDTVTFIPITDPSVRLGNLASRDLHMIVSLAPTDVEYVQNHRDLNFVQSTSLGYQGITFNVDHGEKSNHPLGKNAQLRRAFSLAVNRDIINQVVFAGLYKTAGQPFKPGSQWFNENFPVPSEDVNRARQMVIDAGFDRVPVELLVTNSPLNQQLVQVIQAMVKRAGFDVTLKSMEFSSLLSAQRQGDFEAVQIGWSGRIDPDGNLHQFVTCEAGMNVSKFCDSRVDDYLNAARKTQDQTIRKEHYDNARVILQEQAPLVYLYHQSYLWGLDAMVKGFTPYPDGMIRLENVTLN